MTDKKIKILIDCGARVGKSIRGLNKKYGFDKIYAFECDNTMFERLRKATKSYDAKIIPKAVWTEEGKRKFFTYDENPMSSSLFKRELKFESEFEVETIDFIKWFRENIDLQQSFVVLKLDIEGAEYPILEELMNNDLLSGIDKIYCEFHKRIKGLRKYHEKIKAMLDEREITVTLW